MSTPTVAPAALHVMKIAKVAIGWTFYGVGDEARQALGRLLADLRHARRSLAFLRDASR